MGFKKGDGSSFLTVTSLSQNDTILVNANGVVKESTIQKVIETASATFVTQASAGNFLIQIPYGGMVDEPEIRNYNVFLRTPVDYILNNIYAQTSSGALSFNVLKATTTVTTTVDTSATLTSAAVSVYCTAGSNIRLNVTKTSAPAKFAWTFVFREVLG